MDLTKFISLRPYLFHLTSKENFEHIRSTGGILYSTSWLISKSSLSDNEKREFIRKRRPFHESILIDGSQVQIRDQKPISLTNLSKCLTDQWTTGDFIELLNNNIFFWSTLDRLWRHFNRYKSEDPIILKVDTSNLFRLNNNPRFCKLNSGATRSCSTYGGAPPPRGKDTFLSEAFYPYSSASVAEVTFRDSCFLPTQILIGMHPKGPWNDCLL